MGKVFSGIPQELALNIKKVNKIDFFIETGTCYGETAAWAASVFEKVFTVELSPKLAEIAKGRLSQYQNVFLLEGNSADQLKNILQQMKGISGIFWLDAHYSGGDTAGTGKKAPVEDELTILMQCKETQLHID